MLLTSYANLVEPIGERARSAPARRVLTLIGEDGTHEHLSAAEVDSEARAYAAGLRQAGIGPDDVVVLAIGPLRPLIGAFLGALYRGAVPTVSSLATDRLDPAVHRQRMAELVRGCAARAVLSTTERMGVLGEILDESGCRALSCEDLRVVNGADAPEVPSRRLPDDIAFLQYSSGTAGTRKGIPNTHGAVLRYLGAKRQAEGGHHDVLASWLPLYHDLGLVSGLLYPMVLGLHAVLMSPHHWVRDPKILFHAIHQYRATVCYMPNFALNHCVRGVRERDLEGIELSHWHELTSGGEPVRPESLRMFTERFAPYGFRASALRVGYGMAEVVEGAACSPPGDSPRVDWVDRTRLQENLRAAPAPAEQPGSVAFVSCGMPLSGAELRIVGDRGETLPERRVGEIRIRSDYMFPGYYREPELTGQVMRDGWFCSGDLGYVAQGQLYVTGRKTDLIIVGGRNIQPEDLERVANDLPGLLPGRSVAFGVDDPLLGSQRIVMVCETRPDCDAEEHLALERQLRRRVTHEIGVTLGDVHLVARGWISKTSSGKTARPVNRQKFLQEFGDDRPSSSSGSAPTTPPRR